MNTRIDRPIALDAGLLLIRVIVAVVFLFHGAQKLFGMFDGPGLEGFGHYLGTLGVPAPQLAAVVSACVEFFGGLVLLVGNGTRIAAMLLAINMLVAVLTVHSKAFNAQQGGMEYALTLAVVNASLVLTGPGRFTLMNLFPKKT